MQKVLVWKRANYHELRLLFPKMAIADRFPVYRSQVFSLFDYEFPTGAGGELFLLEDEGGFAVDTLGGLCAFLRFIGYMAESKVRRLEGLGDMGLSKDEAVSCWYREAVSLRVSNLSFFGDGGGSGFNFREFLGLGAYDRLQYCARAGHGEALCAILSQLLKFYGRDGSYAGVRAFRDVSSALSGFNVSRFRDEYRLAGDDEADLVNLLTFLPPARSR